jgi:hypothetical protein
MSNDALGKVGTLEESAHRYGGRSRPRRSVPRGVKTSPKGCIVGQGQERLSDCRSKDQALSRCEPSDISSPDLTLGCLRVLDDDNL